MLVCTTSSISQKHNTFEQIRFIYKFELNQQNIAEQQWFGKAYNWMNKLYMYFRLTRNSNMLERFRIFKWFRKNEDVSDKLIHSWLRSQMFWWSFQYFDYQCSVILCNIYVSRIQLQYNILNYSSRKDLDYYNKRSTWLSSSHSTAYKVVREY